MNTATVSEYQRLVYASRATFKPIGNGTGIDPEIARILMQSRRNNPANGLVGALYYADGYFFQCLEGRVAAIEQLYARLHHDPRHTDLKILGRQAISAPSFSTWAMKFVPNAKEVSALLARHNRKVFDPSTFDTATIRELVELLLHGSNVTTVATSPEALAVRIKRNELMTWAALTLSVVALLLAVFI